MYMMQGLINQREVKRIALHLQKVQDHLTISQVLLQNVLSVAEVISITELVRTTTQLLDQEVIPAHEVVILQLEEITQRLEEVILLVRVEVTRLEEVTAELTEVIRIDQEATSIALVQVAVEAEAAHEAAAEEVVLLSQAVQDVLLEDLREDRSNQL